VLSLMQTKTGTKAATVEPQEKRSRHDARIRDAHTTAFNVIVNLPVVQLAVTTIVYVMLHILATGYLTVCNRNRCNINDSEGDHKLKCGNKQVVIETPVM